MFLVCIDHNLAADPVLGGKVEMASRKNKQSRLWLRKDVVCALRAGCTTSSSPSGPKQTGIGYVPGHMITYPSVCFFRRASSIETFVNRVSRGAKCVEGLNTPWPREHFSLLLFLECSGWRYSVLLASRRRGYAVTRKLNFREWSGRWYLHRAFLPSARPLVRKLITYHHLLFLSFCKTATTCCRPQERRTDNPSMGVGVKMGWGECFDILYVIT